MLLTPQEHRRGFEEVSEYLPSVFDESGCEQHIVH
jgi:hypothetical protein